MLRVEALKLTVNEMLCIIIFRLCECFTAFPFSSFINAGFIFFQVDPEAEARRRDEEGVKKNFFKAR